MRVLIMDMKDDEGRGLDLAYRAVEAGHQVNYWLARASHPAGRGLVSRVADWKTKSDSADLIVLTGNCDYPDGLEEMFAQGYPIFGANKRAAALELDRATGQKVLKRYGIDTIPYQVVKSPEEGIELILDTTRPYVMKPWGGDSDKSMTCVPRNMSEAIFTLWKWKQEGIFKGELMMQEKVEGIEMGISGWFGPGGWSRAIEESFEHKKFLTDDLGENTGEMGTVIRHVATSKLFDQLLEPLTDYLHAVRYVGDCSINCIIDSAGRPWPLEFTMRLGWPDFCIRQAVIQGDPVEWMYDLLHGRDTLEVSPQIALGVVMAHGDFPGCRDRAEAWGGYPINMQAGAPNLHLQDAMLGRYLGLTPEMKTSMQNGLCTGGQYVCIVSGTGESVVDAQRMAYGMADYLRWPSNVMYRTDIGERLMTELPDLQKFGYAVGMKYA